MDGVKYYSMLESSGYGLAAISYMNALLEFECPLYWVPLVLGERGYQPWYQLPRAEVRVRGVLEECLSDESQLERLMACLQPIAEYRCILMHVVPEYWPYLKEKGQHHVGYTVWETDRLPHHFPKLINQADCVLVPSTFNQLTFERSGVEVPIRVVPHILNAFRPQASTVISQVRSLISAPADDTLFYSINTWTSRKAMWTLVNCYLTTFTPDDPVTLVLKTSGRGPRSPTDDDRHDTKLLVAELVSRFDNPARIKVINTKLTQQQIAALHEIGDCFISTSHSEGWGLGLFEAAGAGNPVIATGWGGQLDYLSDQLSFLTRYQLTPVIDVLGEASYSNDQRWAKPDPESVCQLLKWVFSEPESAQVKATTLASKLHHTYNSKKVAAKLFRAIDG